MYGVNTMTLALVVSYLYGRKQYIKITQCNDAVQKDIKYGVPQGSILGSFKWLQLDSNPQPLSSETNTQPFSHTGQMIELSCYCM